jgi:hypothetical protein
MKMAKSKRETVNKSQAIRDALEAHPDKSPLEIATALKAKGLDVNAQYVSTIKSNAKAKGLKRRVVKRRKPGRVVAGNGSADHIMKGGLHFIVLAGGVEQARERLVGLAELIDAAKQVE